MSTSITPLPSGALAETVRKLLLKTTPGPWKDRPQDIPGVTKGRYRYVEFDKNGYTTSPLEPDDARLIALAPEMATEIAQVVARLEQAEQERDDVTKRVSRRLFDSAEARAETAESALAACEHSRDQALAALHYIRQQYGELDGVGWNRLTGERDTTEGGTDE